MLITLQIPVFTTNIAYAEPDQGSYLWNGFDYWFDKIGISGVILTLILYLHKQRSDINKERQEGDRRLRRSSVALLQEIKENREGISRFDRVYFCYVKARQIIEYTGVYLDTYAYQSIIHSGLYTFLDETLQTRLSQLYSRIDSFNETINDRIRIDAEYPMHGNPSGFNTWVSQKEIHDVFLTETQKEIRVLLSEVEEILNQYLTVKQQ